MFSLAGLGKVTPMKTALGCRGSNGRLARKTLRGCQVLVAMLALVCLPFTAEAKSYGSGGRSFSSSRSFSSGGGSSRSYSSGSGRSYSSGSGSGSGRSSGLFSSGSGSGKSYSSGGSDGSSGKGFGRSFSSSQSDSSAKESTRKSPGLAWDSAGGRAKKEANSQSDFNQWKRSQETPQSSSAGSRSYSGSYRPYVYRPTYEEYSTRPIRVEHVFGGYYSRPLVVYHDPYGSLFWWWLLDRSLDDRAYWAYHHRYDMDPMRYQALMATDTNLQARVAALEAQQTAVDPSYTPPGVQRDLMYGDSYVNNAYHTRPTSAGRLLFWAIMLPAVAGAGFLMVWLVFVKRWQTA